MDLKKLVQREKSNGKKRKEVEQLLSSLGIDDSSAQHACDEVYEISGIRWPDVSINKSGKTVINNKSPANFEAFLKAKNIQLNIVLTNTLITSNGTTRKLDDSSYEKLVTMIWETGWKVPKEEVSTYINGLLYQQDEYKFFRDYATRKPWDKKDRIAELFNCLPVRDDGFRHIHAAQFKKWLHGLVAKATNTLHPDGVFNFPKHDFALITQGTEGGKKSAFWRSLLPKLGGNVPIFKEGPIKPGDKDHKIATSRYLIWNISEIDETLRKRDASALKAFITNRFVNERIPYARKESDHVSNCVFCGDTNEPRFLVPGHKNRRFHIIPISGDPIKINHGVDIQQVWAQCLEERLAGYKNWTEGDEEIERAKSQEAYIKIDSISRWLNVAVETRTSNELTWKEAMTYADAWTLYNRYCKLNNLHPSDHSTLENRLDKEVHNERQHSYSRSSKTTRYWLVDVSEKMDESAEDLGEL